MLLCSVEVFGACILCYQCLILFLIDLRHCHSFYGNRERERVDNVIIHQKNNVSLMCQMMMHYSEIY